MHGPKVSQRGQEERLNDEENRITNESERKWNTALPSTTPHMGWKRTLFKCQCQIDKTAVIFVHVNVGNVISLS